MKRALCIFLLILPATLHAEPPETVWLEQLTTTEIAARMKEGTTTIIIPTGGTEPNASYLATGKHNAIVGFTAERVATMLGDALVAPVIAYVPEQGHAGKAGVISLKPATFQALLEDAATSLKNQGFKRIILMGDSAENQAPQESAAAALSTAWKGEGVVVMALSDYYANNGQAAWLKQNKLRVAQPEAHAGYLDIGETLAAKPAYTRGELLPRERPSAQIGNALLMLKIQAAVQEIRRKTQAATAPSPSTK